MKEPIQIIYASTSGNVETVCQYVSDKLIESSFDCILQRAETINIDTILTNKLFIFATSTWEHGVINPYFNKLLKEMEKENLSGKKAIFIGLGDTRYEPVLFCGGMYKLIDAFTKNGGEEIFNPLTIDGEPHRQLDALAAPWTNELIKNLKNAA